MRGAEAGSRGRQLRNVSSKRRGQLRRPFSSTSEAPRFFHLAYISGCTHESQSCEAEHWSDMSYLNAAYHGVQRLANDSTATSTDRGKFGASYGLSVSLMNELECSSLRVFSLCLTFPVPSSRLRTC